MFAIHLGASKFWNALMHVEDVYVFSQWKFHPVEWNVYDVTEFIKPQEPYNISGLELLAFNEEKQLEMFQMEPLKTLVEEKWEKNRHLYGVSALMHFIYMTLFTVVVLCKNITKEDVKPMMEEKPFLVVLTFVVLVVASIFLLIQVADFLRLLYSVPETMIGNSVKSSNLSVKKVYRTSTIRTLFFITDACVIIWAVFRLVGHQKEAIVAITPLVLGWYSGIVYTFFIESICIFMFMLNQIFLTNVVYFLVALFFILIGCSTAFINLQFVSTAVRPEGMDSIFKVLSTLFRQTIAITDIDELMDDFKYPIAARLLMICFLIVATVLLLNMLIAAMNDTYNSVRDRKTELWLRIKLQMALHIERRTFSLLNRMPNCCSYCQPNCKCRCQTELQCKASCKCLREKQEDLESTRNKSISVTYQAIRKKESQRKTLDSIEEGVDEPDTIVSDEQDGIMISNRSKRIRQKKGRHIENDKWKNFFFRIKNENGKRQQTVYLKIKEFVEGDKR